MILAMRPPRIHFAPLEAGRIASLRKKRVTPETDTGLKKQGWKFVKFSNALDLESPDKIAV